MGKSVVDPTLTDEISSIFAAHGQSLTPEELKATLEAMSEVGDEEAEDPTDDTSEDDDAADTSVDASVLEEEEPEESEEPKEPTPKTDKVLRALISEKAKNKVMRDLLRERARESEKGEDEAAIARITQSLKDKNFEDDAAIEMATDRRSVEKLVARTEVLEFLIANRRVLDKYPEAVEDVATIAQRVKATGMTVEQICLGMYGGIEPETVTRQRAAALGTTPARNAKPDPASVTAPAAQKKMQAPTQSQKRLYDQMVQMGVPGLTMEEFMKSQARTAERK